MLKALGKVPGLFDPLDDLPGARELLKERCEPGMSFTPENAIICLLDAGIGHFGYSARDVYGAVFNYKSIIEDHMEAFDIQYPELLAAVTALAKNNSPKHKIANRILAISPVDGEPFVKVKWRVNFKSNWIARSVLRKLGQVQDFEVRQRMSDLGRIPQANLMAGWFFEAIVHRTIAETEGGFWTLVHMPFAVMDSPQFFMSQDATPCVPDDAQFSKAKREVFELKSINDLSTHLKDKTYYIPVDTNFSLFNAFTIDFDYSTNSAVLWILQITTSQSRGGSSIGYRKIREIIAILKDELREQSPPRKKVKATEDVTPEPVKVHYLLIVPKIDGLHLKWQFPSGWDTSYGKNDHRGDVYCLEVPVSVCY